LWLAAALALPLCAHSHTLAPSGCPINHCTPEYTGLTYQPLITTVITNIDNGSLGSLQAEGCSGNGTRLACLYIRDSAPANRKGTLKILNANTLKPVWGSASAPNSLDLDPHSAADGQVPVFFSNGTVAAGDASNFVLYSSAGAVLGTLPVGGQGNDLGLIPISSTHGIVSQGDGVLTLVNLGTWTQEGSLTLTDPATEERVNLIGPSAGSSNVLYPIAYDSRSGTGVLYSVVVDKRGHLAIRSSFSFLGQAGASPVVITPSISGLPANLILLHVPGLIGEEQPKDHLLALSDTGGSEFEQSWAITLDTPVAVSPTVDPGSLSIFYETGSTIHQNALLTGEPIQTYNIKTIGGYADSFRLVGHLGASQVGSTFTLLLAGTYATSKRGGVQCAIEFQPIASPSSLVWVEQIADVESGYTGAWNFAPSLQSGVMCPIAISMKGAKSRIVRLCDH
jgi:hypothetical protein